VLTELRWAYGTLSLQLLLAIPVTRLLRERDAMWEYVFHFHSCLIVTLVAPALWPVARSVSVVRLHYAPGSCASRHTGERISRWNPDRGALMVVNTLLILATFLMGIHYMMDTLAGALLFAVSLLVYQVAERHVSRS